MTHHASYLVSYVGRIAYHTYPAQSDASPIILIQRSRTHRLSYLSSAVGRIAYHTCGSCVGYLESVVVRIIIPSIADSPPLADLFTQAYLEAKEQVTVTQGK